MTERQQRFYKDRFEVISEEKRNQILDAAIEEFAHNGFNGTNINKVAKRAKISIGAMYSYFDSKDDLFLTVVEKLLSVLERVLKEVDVDKDIFEIIEQLFFKAHYYAINYPVLNQIYLDMSTHSLSKLSGKVSGRLETITKDLYLDVIRKAKANNKINQDINERMLSFIVDNLIMMFQFSYTSDYYKERMKIFLGKDLFEDEKKQIEEIMKFIKIAVRPE